MAEGLGANDSLEAYRDACRRWFEWLDGDPEHSISGQLSRIFFLDAVFRSLNEARRIAAETEPTSAVSPFLAMLLDQGYVDGQVLGISKLIERVDPKHPAKGVISLRGLVDDLVANRHLLTRANYLGRDGYPYDYESGQKLEIERNMVDAKDGVMVWSQDVEGPEAWGTAERLHAQFDRLSGVAPADRSPEDLISEAMLGTLSKALADPAFEAISILRNKTVAHAADLFSRDKAKRVVNGLTFGLVDRTHWCLAGVAQVISATVLHGPWRVGAVPVPQQDQFEFLDRPFVMTDRIAELREFWDRHTKAREDWMNEAWAALMPKKGD